MQIFRAIKRNIVSQIFGENKSPLYKKAGMLGHGGTDWILRDGEPIYYDVSDDGIVLENHIDNSGGLGVIVRSKDGDTYYKHRYWHLKQFYVKAGQKVKTGDLLGWGDSTGLSTGPHLHRDLKVCDKNGKTLNWTADYRGAIDYMPFLKHIFVRDLVNISLRIRIAEIIMKILHLKVLKSKLFTQKYD